MSVGCTSRSGERRGGAPKGRRADHERGAVLVEAAIVVPILITLILAIIDYGQAYNTYIALRQGTREGARQASLITNPAPPSGAATAYYTSGGVWSCGSTISSTTPNADAYDLICYTKWRTHLSPSSIRVSLQWGNGYQADFSNSTQIATVQICTETQLSSITGLFSPLLNNKILHTQTETRVEMSSNNMQAWGASGGLGSVQETAFDNWNWCTFP